ncbi:MAG: response regulator [Alphaproteobacteria bacterium]|nr:response regulator [Alphaproteobacteria bacterium]
MLTGKVILAIDDARSIRTFLRISLESQGAVFHEAGTARDGLKQCHDVQPDLVVLDLGLPDEDGMSILADIKNSVCSPSVIVLTVRKENEMKEKARELGADAYITKPFMVDELMDVIEAQVLK